MDSRRARSDRIAAGKLARRDRGRLSQEPWCFLLRRDRRRHRFASHASRRRACRAGSPWTRALGQLCGPAGATHAVRPAQAFRGRQTAPANGFVWHRRCWTMDTSSALIDIRLADGHPRRRPRSHRTHRAHAVAPLWRGVLAAAGARGSMASALARPAARISALGGAWRSARWPLCRGRLRRALRATRSGWPAARDAASALVEDMDLGQCCRSA